jgi:hypothetical protein
VLKPGSTESTARKPSSAHRHKRARTHVIRIHIHTRAHTRTKAHTRTHTRTYTHAHPHTHTPTHPHTHTRCEHGLGQRASSFARRCAISCACAQQGSVGRITMRRKHLAFIHKQARDTAYYYYYRLLATPSHTNMPPRRPVPARTACLHSLERPKSNLHLSASARGREGGAC